MIHPQMVPAVLFTEELEANEAILIEGVPRFLNYLHYGDKFRMKDELEDKRAQRIIVKSLNSLL